MCRRRNAKGKQVAVRKVDGHLSLFVLPCSVLIVLHSSVIVNDMEILNLVIWMENVTYRKTHFV